MKKISKYFIALLLGILFLGSVKASSDTTFVRLDDAAGTIFSNDELQQLRLFSDSLKLALPEKYQEDFKVYDFGFYRHLEVYGEYGFEEAFDDLKPTLTSPYYFLIARQSDKSGMNSKIFIEYKMPKTADYPCVTEEFTITAKALFINAYNADSSPQVGKKMVSGLKAIKALTGKIFSCCDYSEEGTCGLTVNDVVGILSADQFFNYNGLDVEVDGVDGPVSIRIKLDDHCPEMMWAKKSNPYYSSVFDLKAAFDEFQSEMQSAGLKARIRYEYVSDVNAFQFIHNHYTLPKISDEDYLETVYIVNNNGVTQIYCRIDLGGELKASKFDNSNAEFLIGRKVITEWFFKRAATNPTTVVLGVVMDYTLGATFEYWFNQQKHDSWLEAFGFVVKEKGFWGFVISVGTNVIDSPAAIFIGQMAEYLIMTEPENWNMTQMLAGAFTGTVLQAAMSISMKAGSGALGKAGQGSFTGNIAKFVTDVTGSLKGAKLLKECFFDRRLVYSWDIVMGIGKNPSWKTHIPLLKSIIPFEVNPALASKISKERLQDVLKANAMSPYEGCPNNCNASWLPNIEESISDLGKYALKYTGNKVKPMVDRLARVAKVKKNEKMVNGFRRGALQELKGIIAIQADDVEVLIPKGNFFADGINDVGGRIFFSEIKSTNNVYKVLAEDRLDQLQAYIKGVDLSSNGENDFNNIRYFFDRKWLFKDMPGKTLTEQYDFLRKQVRLVFKDRAQELFEVKPEIFERMGIETWQELKTLASNKLFEEHRIITKSFFLQ